MVTSPYRSVSPKSKDRIKREKDLKKEEDEEDEKKKKSKVRPGSSLSILQSPANWHVVMYLELHCVS